MHLRQQQRRFSSADSAEVAEAVSDSDVSAVAAAVEIAQESAEVVEAVSVESDVTEAAVENAEVAEAVSDVVEVEAAEVVENTPFKSVVEGLEIVQESTLSDVIEGRGTAHLFKAKCAVSGAVVLSQFDTVRENARTNLHEPGFRPGDVPPWIKTQLVEFSLTSVMEDVVKNTIEAHGFKILEGEGQDMIKWLENPSELSKTFVLGSPFEFHAAFNATMPVDPSVVKPTTIDAMFEITPAKIARAEKILKDNGKVPGLLSKVGGGSSKAKPKKKPKKKR